MKIVIAFVGIAAVGILVLPAAASAHRSGCHSWHSCPSDSGSYICGDRGYCSQCPDNKFCKKGKPRPVQKAQPSKAKAR